MSENKNVSVIRRPNNEITEARSYGAKELALVKRTCAPDTTDDEFDMFMQICKRQALDPFRRQIYALVFSKDNAKKRKVAFVTGIDGYRAIAKRSGTYRPSHEAPMIEYDDAVKCPDTNPLGIVKVQVAVMQYAIDGWYPVIGSARWEEFAPIRTEVDWVNNKPVPKEDGKRWLEKSTWKEMPELMITKCAEAQALRKGWPEEIGGLYAEEEMHRMQSDMVASDEIAAYEEEKRLKAVDGYNAIPLIMADSEGITMIAEGEVFDKVSELVRNFDDPQTLDFWKERNRHGLQQYWARCPGDALELKKHLEQKHDELTQKVNERLETSDSKDQNINNDE